MMWPLHSEAAERSILAAMMLDAEAAKQAAGMLEPSDFYHAANGRIFGVVVKLVASDTPADMVTLASALAASGDLEAVGGHLYLSCLTDSATVSNNWRHHAAIVKRHRRTRDLRAGAQALASGIDAHESPEAIQQAVRHLAELARPKEAQRGPSHVSVRLSDVFLSGRLPAVPLGLTAFDSLDIVAGQLCAVGARPGVGKTAFLGTVARNAAERDWDVLFISLEMPTLEIQQRLIAGVGGIPLSIVKECADPAMVKAAGMLSDLPLWVEDGNEEPRMTLDLEGIGALVSLFAEVSRGERNRVVLVDYLQFIHTRRRFERRNEAVGHICRELKRFAKDNAIPIIVAAQLNRLVDQRGKDARPQMSDLAESSDIEKNADKLLFLHREPDGRAFMRVAKNRQGPCWASEVRYVGDQCRFEDSDAVWR